MSRWDDRPLKSETITKKYNAVFAPPHRRRRRHTVESMDEVKVPPRQLSQANDKTETHDTTFDVLLARIQGCVDRIHSIQDELQRKRRRPTR
ncbi:hypothetical protein Ae201684P_019410 [Aphanomyces euteiches]|nr:hypothetical protein Ae201684P_019410 [Aphanomyces euteiches]